MQSHAITAISRLALASGLIAILLFAAKAHGQEASQNDQDLPTFRSEVNVVNIFFNVKDKKGLLIPDLKKEDFTVLEDGKPQPIKYFSAESDQPLTLGILIDSSGSQDRVLEYEKEVGAAFLRNVIKPKDVAFVISFDVSVDLLQDFTSSPNDLARALNRAKVNTGGGGGSLPGLGGGPFPTSRNPRGTLLYDAIYLAAHDKLATEVGRKAMIILTDGEDQGSQLNIRDSIEAAQKADAICYVILIADSGFMYQGFGEKDMKKLAEQTGGRVIEASNKPEKLRQAFDQIANELRSQYNIGYTPTNTKLDGTFRKIEIQVNNKKDYRVQARKGYYAIGSAPAD
ncbi:MAG TPA: VWA domain-containing protein [Terriglobales bacterium]|nr:VWA domain-containing protein [Terriglobales bacterium]